MKRILKLASFILIAVLTVAVLVACEAKADYTINKKAFADLNLEANKATTAETVAGTEKTIPGSYKYQELNNNVTLSYDIPQSTAESVDHYTRLFKVSGPADSRAYMLITDEYTADTANWTMWDVLGNIGYPAFQYNELNGGSGSPETMKTFLAGKQTTHQGYWGNASVGNSYEANKQPNGNLKAELEFHFGADKAGDYTVTLEIVNLSDSAVICSVSKTIKVK